MTPTTAALDTAALSGLGIAPKDLLYPDLDHELATTRRVLERVPEGRNDWRPHDKSMKLGDLAAHLAQLPRLAAAVLGVDELDWAKTPFQPPTVTSTADLLALFDKESAAMRAAVAGASWADIGKRWVMRAGDQIFVEGLKGRLIRTLGISHIVHHRAQLGVYLRLLGIALPSVYGPTADES